MGSFRGVDVWLLLYLKDFAGKFSASASKRKEVLSFWGLRWTPILGRDCKVRYCIELEFTMLEKGIYTCSGDSCTVIMTLIRGQRAAVTKSVTRAAKSVLEPFHLICRGSLTLYIVLYMDSAFRKANGKPLTRSKPDYRERCMSGFKGSRTGRHCAILPLSCHHAEHIPLFGKLSTSRRRRDLETSD